MATAVSTHSQNGAFHSSQSSVIFESQRGSMVECIAMGEHQMIGKKGRQKLH